MIVGFHHVAIATRDLARLSRFYCGQFGLEVLYQGGWQRGNAGIDAMVGLKDSSADLVVLGAGAFRLEIFQYHTPAGREAEADRPVCDSGITHLCMQVSDIDGEYARLSRAGMRFHCPPASAAAGQRHRATYGRDPDGNVIELIEILAADHPFGTPAAA
jgi:catechol 2,3-dioxygenase-like lactoylglutathione lyase family enzyme